MTALKIKINAIRAACGKTRCHLDIVGHVLYTMFVRARRPRREVSKNLDISHIYIGALENIPSGLASALDR